MYPKIKTTKSNILISPPYDTKGNGFTQENNNFDKS